MTTLYEYLHAPKGPAYRPEQIKDYSWLRIRPGVDKTPGRLAGNSRVVGDASKEIQSRVIDLLVELGVRYKLNYRDIAHMLLLTKVESGFNPDAAAGTTSAAGLGQYTKATADEAAKVHISKRRLGFVLRLDGENVFDAQKGAYGVLLSYMICKERAVKRFGAGFEDHLYLFHHEGWYFSANEAQLGSPALKSVYEIIRKKIKPHLPLVEKMLKQASSIRFELRTSDDAGYPDQPFVAIMPSASSLANTAPALTQHADPSLLDIVIGRTDGSGLTPVFNVKALAEVVFVLLNREYKQLLGVRPQDQSYTIKSGETLGRIAKRSGTTAEAIARANNISDVDRVSAGQTIRIPGRGAGYTVQRGDSPEHIATEHGTTVEELARLNDIKDVDRLDVGQELTLFDGARLQRRPDRSFVAGMLAEVLGLESFAAADAIVEHSRSHVSLPPGNEAHKGGGAVNIVSIRGGSTAEQVGQRANNEDVPHSTNERGEVKTVGVTRPLAGSPLRTNMLFPLPKRPAVSYKTGARVFGYRRTTKRKHAGRDLYAPLGTTVRAMDDGVVLAVNGFYCQTDEVVIDHGGFIVRYGEVRPARDLPGKKHFVSVGDRVKRGQKIAEVGDLVGIDAPCMLHIEMYATAEGVARSPLTDKQNLPFMRRADLVDPLATLEAAVME